MNQICLTGRITKDLVVEKAGKSQISKTVFNLAVTRDYKNSEGKYEADFPRIVAWKGIADYLLEHAEKGTLIEVVGKIQTGSYVDKNKQKVYTTDVVANSVRILSSGSSAGSSDEQSQKEDFDDDLDEYPDIDIDDNKLPFGH